MQFNDTTNGTGLIQSCENWAGYGDTAISGDTATLKKFTRLINTTYDKVVSIILDAIDGTEFDDPNLGNSNYLISKNLTANTRKVTLALSDSILKIRRVEVSYDGVNYKKAEPLAMEEFTSAFEDPNVDQYFYTDSPRYRQFGMDVYLYPAPENNVTGGLKIIANRKIDYFTTADTTQEPGIPVLFHDMLAIGASMSDAISRQKDNAGSLAQMFADYEVRLRRFVGTQNKDIRARLEQDYVDYR